MALYNPNYNYQQPMMTPYQTPQVNQNYNSTTDTGIVWVQGESGAKAYPVQPGKSVVLFDSETEHFFIKSADMSGMPQPLRIFSYSETSENEMKQPDIDTSMFITREEFERAINDLKKPVQQTEYQRKGGNRNDKSLISANAT